MEFDKNTTVKAVKKFIENYGVDYKNDNGMTSLMNASYISNIGAMFTLIQAGCNVNEKNNEGKTALIITCDAENKRAVKFLISNGADVNLKDNLGKTALMYCKRDKEIVDMLIENGADVNAICNNTDSVLMNYISDHRYTMAHHLLKKGVNINYSNNDGKTALIIAVALSYDMYLLEKLVEQGADLRDSNGDHVIVYCKARKCNCCEGDYYETFEILTGKDYNYYKYDKKTREIVLREKNMSL